LIACLAADHARAQSEQPATPAPVPEGEGADTDGASVPEAAVEHYRRGRKWYLMGRYRDALQELKLALEHDPDSPDLIYNVARVYENLGEFDESIAYYQRYIAHLPADSSAERERSENTIRRLQGAKREHAAQEKARAKLAPPEPSIGRADFVFWLTGGAALALLGGGAATGILALKTTDDVGAFVVGPDGTFSEREKLAKRADTFALASDGLLIGGAVALTGAALLYLLRDAEQPPSPRSGRSHIGLAFDGRAGQLSVSGRF
jgi:tetratricopeptide (TPR) repeat protein